MRAKKYFNKKLLGFYNFLFTFLTGITRRPAAHGNGIKYYLKDGRILGVFYDSYSKLHHLSFHIPYSKLPSEYLCRGTKNFSSSASENKYCHTCYNKLIEPYFFKSLVKFLLMKIINK
jgi:hypothetical protein